MSNRPPMRLQKISTNRPSFRRPKRCWISAWWANLDCQFAEIFFSASSVSSSGNRINIKLCTLEVHVIMYAWPLHVCSALSTDPKYSKGQNPGVIALDIKYMYKGNVETDLSDQKLSAAALGLFHKSSGLLVDSTGAGAGS